MKGCLGNSHNEEDILMQVTSSYETAAVVFLDVLGTTKRTAFQDKYAIHRLFHEEVEQNEARQEQSPHVVYKRTLRSFSDCVYIFYTYKDGIEEERKNHLNLLYICLYNTSVSILRLLSAGYFVRGGACVGDLFIDALGFFGPSVECAYGLESKHALYPRILIEDAIGKMLFDWERSRDMNQAMAILFKTIPRLIIQDDKGRFFLNVFYALQHSGILKIGELDLTLEDMKVRIIESIKRNESNEDAQVLAKLSWMKAFTQHSNQCLNDEYVNKSVSIVLGQ